MVSESYIMSRLKVVLLDSVTTPSVPSPKMNRLAMASKDRWVGKTPAVAGAFHARSCAPALFVAIMNASSPSVGRVFDDWNVVFELFLSHQMYLLAVLLFVMA